MSFQLRYSRTSYRQIKALHPNIKPIVKTKVQELKENPYLGKALEKELSGYRSLRTKRFRIIYRVDHENRMVQIHYVGHRKDVYELFKEWLAEDE
ncbi:MAG: type II toxin-antitoxin system RelE/ParE family toxin [Pseudomonadota bacterium]